jgi:hypothetical protein
VRRARDRARVLPYETPQRLSMRSPYYVMPVAWLAPPDGCVLLPDAEAEARVLSERLKAPVAVVIVIMQVASVDAEDGGQHAGSQAGVEGQQCGSGEGETDSQG